MITNDALLLKGTSCMYSIYSMMVMINTSVVSRIVANLVKHGAHIALETSNRVEWPIQIHVCVRCSAVGRPLDAPTYSIVLIGIAIPKMGKRVG